MMRAPAPRLSQSTFDPPPRIAAAAWLASLAGHLCLAVLGTLLFPTSLPSERRPPATTAGIVLARRTASQTQYFQDRPSSPVHAASAMPRGASPHTVFKPAAEAAASEALAALAMLPDTRQMPTLGPLAQAVPAPDGGLDVALSDLPVGLKAAGGATGRPRLGISPEDLAAILAEDAAQPREQRPTGPTASLSLFGLPPAVGRSFVLVIDRSQSMGAGGLDVLRAAARELAQQLASLTPQQTVQVVAYNESVVYGTGPHLAPATEEHRAALVAFVAHLPAYGQTEHVRGLLAALKLKPEVIFLLTDGGDPVPDGNQLQLVRRLAAGRIQIHCLHFGRGPADERAGFLQRLARDTGGQYRYYELR